MCVDMVQNQVELYIRRTRTAQRHALCNNPPFEHVEQQRAHLPSQIEQLLMIDILERHYRSTKIVSDISNWYSSVANAA